MIEPLLRSVHGTLLRQLRHNRHLRLSDVAARAGISAQYLSEVERGRKEPSSEVLAAICGALGSDMAALSEATHLHYRRLHFHRLTLVPSAAESTPDPSTTSYRQPHLSGESSPTLLAA